MCNKPSTFVTLNIVIIISQNYSHNLTEFIRLPYDILAGVEGLEPPFLHYGLTA